MKIYRTTSDTLGNTPAEGTFEQIREAANEMGIAVYEDTTPSEIIDTNKRDRRGNHLRVPTGFDCDVIMDESGEVVAYSIESLQKLEAAIEAY